MLWPIQTDFVLTTRATHKQSQIFPQHIAPETPLQHVRDFRFFEEKKLVSQICFSQICFSNMCSFLFTFVHWFHLFSFFSSLFSIRFIFVHCLFIVLVSFHFFSFPAFLLVKNITNPDHLHVDPLLSFADMRCSGGQYIPRSVG